MANTNRRSLILGAALGTVMPSLVRAESMVHIPGDPLTKLGLRAAEQWASEEFSERPGCRLVFASGHKHRWFEYQTLSRPLGEHGQRDYAVALEVAITDAQGRRFVSSHPVDGRGIEQIRERRMEKNLKYLDSMGVPYEGYW